MTAPPAALRQAGAVALADLRERTRRYSFLVTLAGTLYFGYLASAGYVRLTFHGQRGVLNSAWVGTLMGLSVGAVLSLVGFYLVKNTLQHDRRTGVGEILAATPLWRTAYTVGKALSNLLLLGSIVALLAAAAAITQLLAREDTHLRLGALLLPLALLALPPVALAAALAVLFEAVRWLRGALGNVAFFFLWSAGLGLAAAPATPPALDVMGIKWVEASLARQLPGGGNGSEGISLNIGPREPGEAGTEGAAGSLPPPPRRSGLRWQGIEWTAGIVAQRCLLMVAALGLALLAAVPFSRFDPARERARRVRGGKAKDSAAGDRLAAGEPAAFGMPADAASPGGIPPGASPSGTMSPSGAAAAAPASLEAGAGTARAPGATAVARWREGAGGPPSSRFPALLPLIGAELRLMLRGRDRWWSLVAAGLVIAGFAVPTGEIAATLLAVAWIWPLPVWSELGARDALHGTRPLLISSPLPPALQVAAAWAAGSWVTALAGSGVALRLALAGDGHGLVAWAAGCLFIPALALCLGTLSGSPRLFEVVYLLLWYSGPINHVAELDFTGLSAPARAAGLAPVYALTAVALIGVAALARATQARG